MQRRAGSRGETTASRLKSLYGYVQSEHGPAAADAFLARTKLDREYLSDETRLVPIELWHNALVSFASRWGRDAIAKTAPHVVGPENLGVWTHVLRGADGAEPLSAYVAHGGTAELDDDMVELFDLEWWLWEVAEYAVRFHAPHDVARYLRA